MISSLRGALNTRRSLYLIIVAFVAAALVSVGAPAPKAVADATATISGTVTLPQGAPSIWFSAMTVTARNTDGQWSLGHTGVSSIDQATGKYTITGLVAGDYEVGVTASSYSSTPTGLVAPNVLTEYYGGSRTAAGSTPVSLSNGANRTGIDFATDLGAKITGSITGIPPQTWGLRILTTDGQVNWEASAFYFGEAFEILKLVPGTYLLQLGRAVAPFDQQLLKSSPLSYQFVVSQDGLSGLSLTAQPTTASIAGTLTAGGFSTNGGGALDASIAEPVVYQQIDSGWLRIDFARPSAIAKNNGAAAFTVPGLAPGTYTVGFEKSQTPYSGMQDLAAQYWNQKASLAAADAFSLAAGQAATGVNGTVAPLGSVPETFTDVSATPGTPAYSAFANEISWMATQGITTGYSVGDGLKEYRPFGNVTRDAMAAFLYRYAGSPDFTPPTTSPFADVPVTNGFYKEIAWLASTGITTGYDIGGGRKEFRPFAFITRDAMAAFLYRYAESPEYTPPATSPFIDVPTAGSFYKEIAWLASTGVTTGWEVSGGKEFRPFNNITRDAMAAFLYRYAHL